MSINIVKATSTHNTGSKANRTISYIVTHFTAGTTSKSGSAKNTANYFATTTNQASADFIVDDANIVQYNPDLKNRYCWHCGGKRQSNQGGSLYGVCKNANSIGIEICSTSKTGKVVAANNANWYYTDAAVNKAVELTRYLMGVYGIDASHVIRHFDVTGKYCPGIIGWNEPSGDTSQWKAFRARIAGADGQITISTAITPGSYKVTASALNVRSGAGTGYSKLAKLANGALVTVTGGDDQWAEISYNGGKAYVSAQYLEKVAETKTEAKEETKAEAKTETKADQKEEEEMTLTEFQSMFNQLRANLQDNDASEWSKEAREWAVENGLVNGTDADKFNGAWEDFLTREQLVTILYRFSKMQN